YDWSKTSLGSIDLWPQRLKAAVELMVGARTRIAIFWGSDLILLYNDTWSESIGSKHPWALGQPAKAVFPEIWDTIGASLEKVLAGRGSIQEHDPYPPLDRERQAQNAWFDYSLNPILNEDGSVGGVFNIAIEITDTLRSKEALRESEERLRATLHSA